MEVVVRRTISRAILLVFNVIIADLIYAVGQAKPEGVVHVLLLFSRDAGESMRGLRFRTLPPFALESLAILFSFPWFASLLREREEGLGATMMEPPMTFWLACVYCIDLARLL